MNLQILKDNIVAPDNEIALVQFIRENKLELERFFVSKSDEDIESEKFELHDLCLDFINSTVFQATRLKEIPEIVELLTLFAELFEKIGFIGGIAVIKANLPPKSSIRKRLDAVSLFMKIGNVKVDYIQKFDNILSNLQKAQDFAEFDYTGQVVQDTITYYLKGTKALKDSGNIEELTFFKSHFNSPISRTNFKFLNHPNLKEYLDGYITEKVIVEVISDKIYTPSLVCQKIFQTLILDQIHLSGYLTRYSSDEIRADILNYGRADFTKPYKDLSPYDKTQLYCYFNMRKHFFTSYAIYEKIYMSLNSAVFNKDRNFTFIDLGCGPITSGLALASLYFDNLKKPLKVKYVYVDIANSMLQKAGEFSSTELFDNQSEFHALSSWEDIDSQFIENIVKDNAFVVFNASYLFASSSLNEKSLADFVNKVVMKLNASAYFIFQNPDRADRNQKYQNFKRFISSKVEFSNTQKIYYRNKRNSYDEPSSENVNFEILSL